MTRSHTIDLENHETKSTREKDTYLEANIMMREATSVSNIITTEYSEYPQRHSDPSHLAYTFFNQESGGGKGNSPRSDTTQDKWEMQCTQTKEPHEIDDRKDGWRILRRIRLKDP